MSDDGEHPHDAPQYGDSVPRADDRPDEPSDDSPDEPLDQPLDGRLIGGRYRLTERIGSGGMGTVWKAVDELVEREVAVKQPRLPGDPDDPADEHRQRAAHRLYREARAAARVDHPSAVTIHDVVIEDGLPWIVMEWVRGESLHELLRRGALTATETARIGLAVVGALHSAHRVGIVHRDVKPANVLLGPHGRVVLTDFGIAHVQGEEALTASGEFVGSIEFIAPERMSGRTAGPPSDLWSLGVLLYAAVEGWSPFRRTTLESTLAAILSTEPPEPEHAGPLAPLILRLLAKDPAARPEADEVTTALEAVAAGKASGPGKRLGEDAGTLRLGRTAPPEPPTSAGPAASAEPPTSAGPAASSEPPTPSDPSASSDTPLPAEKPAPTRGVGRLLVIAAATGAVLAGGGVWLGTSLAGNDAESVFDAEVPSKDMDDLVGPSATPDDSSGADPSPTAGTRWIPHEEKQLNAVLSLPGAYERGRAEGGKDGRPRTVTYDGEKVIHVRLTQWDKAPTSPMKQAKDSTDIVSGDVKSTAQYTSTSFHDQEAVLADTTHYLDGTPTRVMELIVRTDDSRMYELRVDMPKGTPDEKKGTAVFKGARDRLKILAM
ncbi:serine/threonine-protein kinase [Streptomyces ipomoeae]|uniref:serine/threonine-protein kinase n=1 Tax=Streptomyces ipomoeae TaxID=103232 RepID=UPI00114758B5|nr:serine/threonine-protein kinase [Streptomyces ipomoeae]TQE24125.1 serine/threonine protein kinase [Streptomyces ipomoeae]